VEGVGDALLLGDDRIVERLDAVRLALERDREHRYRDSDRRAELLRNRLDVAFAQASTSFNCSSNASSTRGLASTNLSAAR